MIEVVQAFDRSPIKELVPDDETSLERKLSTAARLFADRTQWLAPYRRMEILGKVTVIMANRREHLAMQIAREGGKPLTDALVEVDRAIDGIHNAADTLRGIGGGEIQMGLTAASVDRRAFTIREPIGIVVAISAFNHPLNLAVHQLAPAIAVGCPIIIKPASATPLSALEMVSIFYEAGLPEGWAQSFVPEARGLSEKLATDPRVAFVSFIGSGRVGWHLRSQIAPGTRCALEHGGVAPVIVDSSADLDVVIEPLVKGGYYHAGQVCVSVQRIYVHADLQGEFLSRFSARVRTLKTGDPTLKETDVGPLINPGESERVAGWIEEAATAGAEVIGGGRLNESTLFPAIIVNPPANAKVSTHEAFGPLTCVFPYTELDDAIKRANSLSVAFQSSIFSENLSHALYAAERLDASAVMINDHTAFRTDWMPFAGRRESGYGIGGIPWTMHEMTQQKMIVFKSHPLRD